jgi:hypothetical protein
VIAAMKNIAPHIPPARCWSFRYFLSGILINALGMKGPLLNGGGSLLLWVASAAFLAGGVGSRWGTAGRWGIGCLFGLVLAPFLSWAIWLARILTCYPLPPCRRGKCRGIGDFTWPIGWTFGREKWGTYYYKCSCGDEYVREGKQFMELLSDGTKRPYKKLVAFRKWADDEASPIPSG